MASGPPAHRDLPQSGRTAKVLSPSGAREPARTRRTLLLGCVGIALLGAAPVWKPGPRLLWNVSASARVGLYRVVPAGDSLRRGDMVVARLPASMRRLAAERHYLPANVPLVKRIAAVEGDHVCAIGEWVFVNGSLRATRLNEDRRGRTMPWWTGCETLGRGRFLLLMSGQAGSFDGRYFGPVGSHQIMGKAVLLWAR